MKISEFITSLTAKGYNSFTATQAKEALNVSDIAARAALRRLKQKGALAQPSEGFYVIVSPEYRILGCRPAEHFITDLMKHLNIPYYVGLLSAAQYYGAAHHRPQQFQIITNQKRRAITCGRIKIVFITKKDIEKTPIQSINTPQGVITASSPEATAMDLVIYASRCGGLDNVLTVLTDLSKIMDAKKLAKLASQSKEITWIQRLGYLLDSINERKLSANLENKIKKRAAHVRLLIPLPPSIRSPIPAQQKGSAFLDKKTNKAPRLQKNKKWKLIINKKLEPDI